MANKKIDYIANITASFNPKTKIDSSFRYCILNLKHEWVKVRIKMSYIHIAYTCCPTVYIQKEEVIYYKVITGKAFDDTHL
jgi:hypothetical protein